MTIKDQEESSRGVDAGDLLASQGLFTCSLVVDAKAIDEKARAIPVIASTDAVDHHGEVVEQNFRLERFTANPIYLWDHNKWGQADTEPLGHAEDVRVEKISGGRALKMTLIHASPEVSARAERIFRSFVEGHQRAVSIGFKPHRVFLEIDDDQEIFHLDENELYEISATPIPSNPASLSERSLTRRRAELLQLAYASGCPVNAPLERRISAELAKHLPERQRSYSFSGLATGNDNLSNAVGKNLTQTPVEQTRDQDNKPPAAASGESATVDPKDLEIKTLKEALEKANVDKLAAERGKTEHGATLQTRDAELAAEREKSLRLESERDEARKESEQRKTLLDETEARYKAAAAERDEHYGKLVDAELTSLSGKKIMPDEIATMKALAESNPALYKEQLERVNARAELPLLKSNVIPDGVGGDAPVTGTPEPVVKSMTDRIAEKRSGRVVVGAMRSGGQ